ncbi:hypothetical protein [Sphingomonas sp.]|uniref:hypothetical protein n=1 Tax=Sphingomonas sp. TaxID=28214 RepID=UPI003B005276
MERHALGVAGTRSAFMIAACIALTVALGGCGRSKQSDAHASAREEGNTKRQQTACASPTAYDRLKGQIFDQAISEHTGKRASLDVLADYSLARMEEPVVTGWDAALDVTHCRGHLVLEVPPGAERAFAGERHLQADIAYTAQAAADGAGYVYRLSGAEPIVAKLAAFNMTTAAYRPPPAIDETQAPAGIQPNASAPLPRAVQSEATPDRGRAQSVAPQTLATGDASQRAGLEPSTSSSRIAPGAAGEATVRAFYSALGVGDGASASTRIIPQKRSSGPFSPEALSRFYGSLPEPIRLTEIKPLSPGSYRVNYRYSAGRSRCGGSAIVSLDARSLIRSIRALNGC